MSRWLSANDAVRSSDCAVPGCTGTASARNTLCPWHIANGTPDMIRADGATRPNVGRQAERDKQQARRARLEQQAARLDDTIRQLADKRARLAHQLDADGDDAA